MPASLSFDRYVAVVAGSTTRMLDEIGEAGFDADVVTCPAWDGRSLLAHQTMVHRWATAHITGTDPEAVPNQTTIRETVEDIGSYFRDGADLLLRALRQAPDDLEAMVFLNDAPSPKMFWARRQAHENTIHAIDAVSARLGRVPIAAEAAIERDVAVDGIDELLCGFFTRGRSKLFDGTEYDVLVAPDDHDECWLVHVSERLTVDKSSSTSAPVVISGSSAAVYQTLWNRGDEATVSGDDTLLSRWHSTQRVRWS
jgi:uncharacterized protein (TIGR03083 family)